MHLVGFVIRIVELDFVLINPDLQDWPQRHAILRCRYIRNKVNGEHFHKTLRQQKFLLLRRSLSIVTSAWGLGKRNETNARRKECFFTTATKPALRDTEGSFLREWRCQMVQLTLKNEGNFESSETTHPTTQSHLRRSEASAAPANYQRDRAQDPKFTNPHGITFQNT